MSVTAALVKELREKSGAGMMDCKKALAETDGDMEAGSLSAHRLGNILRDLLVRSRASLFLAADALSGLTDSLSSAAGSK